MIRILPQVPSVHASQTGLVEPGPVVGLWEFDVELGADIAALRRGLGATLDLRAVLGLSSSLLGTLDPLAMPGGFRPFDLHQRDLVLWANGPDEVSCRSAGAGFRGALAGLAVVGREVVGPFRSRAGGVTGPPPCLLDGPGAGGTYLVLVAGAPPPDGDATVGPDGAGVATTLMLRSDLEVLTGLDRRTDSVPAPVEHGGLYLVPEPAAARRLTSPSGG
jgi:hypothetical protein